MVPGQPAPSAPQTTPASPGIPVIVHNKEDVFFEQLFRNYPGVFDSVLANRKNWKVQIVYTEIDRDKNGNPVFHHHYFNRNNVAYFYPASTVKLPVVLLALQKLQDLNTKGISRNTTMITGAEGGTQTEVYNEPNSKDGRPTLEQYIRKILLVSDNDAFNRLYEFLGQEYINRQMMEKGYKESRIIHRLGIFLSEEENRYTNPISFYDSRGQLLYRQPAQKFSGNFSGRGDTLGHAYYSMGKLIEKPMNFSSKNKLPLEDLHSVLMGLVFPSRYKSVQRFNISEEDRKLVLTEMSKLPRESVSPQYDTSYYDAYTKFLLMGAERRNLPEGVRIFNKSGNAYGQLTDAAYIVDFNKGIEFFLSATIDCNMDGILNDDKYEYNTIGYPFLKSLGQAVYEYESRRKKNNLPDLSGFRFSYDK
jgi:hypothetical protein